MQISSSRTALLGAAAALISAAVAQGVPYSVVRLSSNAPVDVASQMIIDVTDAGGGQVDFRFTNNVGIESSITRVYFDDGVLAGMASVSGSSGVSFSGGATPNNLPGGNTASPPFQADFSAGANAPVSHNGVNAASEFLTVRFNLGAGQSFQDVLSALDSGSLRVGLHVQAIGPTGDSDSFLSGGVIPAPGAVLLGALGLGGLALNRRRDA